MKKKELEVILKGFLNGLPDLLINLRRAGKCNLCKMQNGIQHDPNCPVWPLILARSEYWRFENP